MSSITDPDIEEYCARHSLPDDELLERLAVETRRDFRWHRMMIGSLEGSLLYTIARLVGARRIVEIGTFTGCSAIWLGRALPEDGRLHCLDKDPVASAVALRYLAEAGLGERTEVHVGDALETLAKLEGPFDLVFLDADKERYVDYLEAVVDRLAPRGVVVADNMLWSGRVLDPKEASDHALVRFAAHVRDDPRYEPVLLPVRDGVMLICRAGP